jgi:response regulator of citrate/malate metabolism
MLPLKTLQIRDIEEICIIDDDTMALFLAEKIFEYEVPNIPVKGFENVDDSLAYLLKHQGVKRLIFVDLNMPKKDGWCFLENYQGNIDQDIIFILSASDNYLDKTKAKSFAQVTDYLEKPITIERIVELMEKY